MALRRLEAIDAVELTMKPPVFDLEVVAGIIWPRNASCARAIYRTIDEWHSAAGIVVNPVVRRRRPVAGPPVAGDQASEPLDLEGALELAIRTLNTMM